ncbi:hypothetical protein RhiirA5_379526 [Rhizophagus irregularis]|uniref:Uncharacterized protein n=1 Tax=Rhizophagus irregularis TaxID=588596 RepID=A0A2I1EX25_9GLOM|nr:hypothetical protein RhiirA5_379526 [Rhizophagus irregularis]PKC59996.1 hypothetical protein RhiirA1_399537 [Rhizophagus irregularis]PKY26682.1 hypothetical protein RhiirB3_389739 [Rhizophagus irregularis]CAB4473896.1 unnamed protein product [Rhizophagus irregularis]CAB5211430.1 unnamed protein product [Rhizophagus irregularis]
MSNLASRYAMMEGNTNFQFKLHQEMTAFNDAFILGKSISVIPRETKDDLYIPSEGGTAIVDNPLSQDSRFLTSDDTKEIERRPRKRLTMSHFSPIPPNGTNDRLKRRRQTPATADDSTDAGPSGSSTNI